MLHGSSGELKRLLTPILLRKTQRNNNRKSSENLCHQARTTHLYQGKGEVPNLLRSKSVQLSLFESGIITPAQGIFQTNTITLAQTPATQDTRSIVCRKNGREVNIGTPISGQVVVMKKIVIDGWIENVHTSEEFRKSFPNSRFSSPQRQPAGLLAPLLDFTNQSPSGKVVQFDSSISQPVKRVQASNQFIPQQV